MAKNLQLIAKRKLQTGQADPNILATQLAPEVHFIASSRNTTSGATRSFNTTFQNKTGRLLLVTINSELAILYHAPLTAIVGWSRIDAYVGIVDPPDKVAGILRHYVNVNGPVNGFSSTIVTMHFIVEPNQYYRVNSSKYLGGNDPAGTFWWEMVLRY